MSATTEQTAPAGQEPPQEDFRESLKAALETAPDTPPPTDQPAHEGTKPARAEQETAAPPAEQPAEDRDAQLRALQAERDRLRNERDAAVGRVGPLQQQLEAERKAREQATRDADEAYERQRRETLEWIRQQPAEAQDAYRQALGERDARHKADRLERENAALKGQVQEHGLQATLADLERRARETAADFAENGAKAIADELGLEVDEVRKYVATPQRQERVRQAFLQGQVFNTNALPTYVQEIYDHFATLKEHRATAAREREELERKAFAQTGAGRRDLGGPGAPEPELVTMGDAKRALRKEYARQ